MATVSTTATSPKTTSAMTPRERVRAVFQHELPDRVPVWLGCTPEFGIKALRELGLNDSEALMERMGDDFRRMSVRASHNYRSLPPGTEGVSFFGVPKKGLGCGQPLCHPLANAGLREIEGYPWPNPKADVEIVLPRSATTGRYAVLGGAQTTFFHDLIDLLGMEALGLKMHDAPELIDAVLARIVDYYVALNRRIFDQAAHLIDIFFLFNDFGCQHGPMVGEAMFRRFLAPHLRRLAELGHDYNLKVMLHSCGSIYRLIPAIIECGIDALHPVQPCRGMDLARIKAEFGDKLVLNGGIDAQHTLIYGTPTQVRDKTREVLGIMKPGGGYIGGASHDTILGDTPVANVLAMFDTLREQGRYAARA